MENALKTNIKPVGYSSPFTFEGEKYSIEGKFRANQEKKLIGIDGTVYEGEGFKCTFNGESVPSMHIDGKPSDNELKFSVSSIQSLKEGQVIMGLIEEAVEAVNNTLKQIE